MISKKIKDWLLIGACLATAGLFLLTLASMSVASMMIATSMIVGGG